VGKVAKITHRLRGGARAAFERDGLSGGLLRLVPSLLPLIVLSFGFALPTDNLSWWYCPAVLAAFFILRVIYFLWFYLPTRVLLKPIEILTQFSLYILSASFFLVTLDAFESQKAFFSNQGLVNTTMLLLVVSGLALAAIQYLAYRRKVKSTRKIVTYCAIVIGAAIGSSLASLLSRNLSKFLFGAPEGIIGFWIITLAILIFFILANLMITAACFVLNQLIVRHQEVRRSIRGLQKGAVASLTSGDFSGAVARFFTSLLVVLIVPSFALGILCIGSSFEKHLPWWFCLLALAVFFVLRLVYFLWFYLPTGVLLKLPEIALHYLLSVLPPLLFLLAADANGCQKAFFSNRELVHVAILTVIVSGLVLGAIQVLSYRKKARIERRVVTYCVVMVGAAFAGSLVFFLPRNSEFLFGSAEDVSGFLIAGFNAICVLVFLCLVLGAACLGISRLVVFLRKRADDKEKQHLQR